MNNDAKKIFLVFFACIVLFVCMFLKNEELQSYVFRDECFDCHIYNYEERLSTEQYEALRHLSDYNNIKKIKIKYSRFLSKTGKISVYYQQKEGNETIHKKGIFDGIEPNKIYWDTFNTVYITMYHDHVLIQANNEFFKSDQTVFINAIINAIASSHVQK